MAHVKRRNLNSVSGRKLLKVFILVQLLNVNVLGYRTQWWHTENHNYNHNQNQIGPYQDDGGGGGGGIGGYRHPYTYDARQPKDIMVDVINNMGLALLEAHNEHNENNIAISPYGATSVLVALLEGLVGEAAYEIQIATQLPPDLSIVRIGLRDIHRHLKSYFIPKEGFLAGLTLSHDNITLNREYQSILKFYGYDIESFNNPVYPELSTTSTRPAVTVTTGKITGTMGMETRTESMSTKEMTTDIQGTTTTSRADRITTMVTTNDEESTPEGTTQDTTEGTTMGTAIGTTMSIEDTQITTTILTTTGSSEGATTIADLPSPSDEDIDESTTKRLPTRSYTTEPIDVTDIEGRTETFYPITTLSLEDLETESIEEPIQDISQDSSLQEPLTEQTLGETQVVTDITPATKEKLRGTTRNRVTEIVTEPDTNMEDINKSTIHITTKDIKSVSSFRTNTGEFFEATTLPGTTNSIPTSAETVTTTFTTTTTLDSSTERRTTQSSGSSSQDDVVGSSAKYETTTFEGTPFFAMDPNSTEEVTLGTDINNDTTENITTESLSTTTQLEDFETLTVHDNEILTGQSQKLANLDLNETAPQPTNIPVSEITFTTSEPLTAYIQTRNTEATSLEDQILGNKTYQVAGKIVLNDKLSGMIEKPMKSIPKRKRRSVVDYLIARYYDNYYINNNRRYVPPEDSAKTHYSNYQPEQPYTFLVNGKHKETNISFMTYDTILPFYYIRSLDAMALSFPLDSNMYYLLLVLPLDAHGIDKLVYDMRKTASLRHIVERLQYTHVKAVIPSFMLKGYVVLTPTLQKLCIRKIFEPRHANFSPMTPEPNLYVTNIEQAVTVTIRNYVDPASHSARNLNQYRPVEFRADHPFLYFVMDSEIHVNLMAGKIINPLNSRIR